MKHTAVLLSLIAVATAAKLPNASPDIADVVARHDGHPEQNTTIPGDGHDQDLEKRRGGGAGGAGGAGGGHSSGAGGSRGGSSGTSRHSSTDIAQTILYANARGLPFLATTGGHGTSKWLATGHLELMMLN
ncbi:uncharacterized protein B0H64DRAFT_477933 [Chaetomium fimeti]|uniref:FAD-binding PCMH-type domain-containing protein n=1 Tax=Chaetomium fimeti TaxID=1854472 RepID=A0AAE0LNT2_9PEZI|nr:hypothetical protein B0H64DRAFT_477933 [Chaetomium fimeti]